MADEDIWMEIGMLPPTDLVEARQHAHHALQWLGRVSRALRAPESDDSHTALLWDGDMPGFCTQAIPSKHRLLQFCVRLPDLSLILRIDRIPVASIRFDGHSDPEIGEWLVKELRKRGLDPSAINDEQPYEIPPHPLSNGQVYKVSELAPALTELLWWYAGAAMLFADVKGVHANLNPGPSPIYCWPHHFDLAILLTIEEGDAETAKSIGIGLSPGDESYNQPYFYVNPWPHLNPEDLPSLVAPGRWHVEGFVGAVAPATEILKLPEPYLGTWGYLMQAIEIGHRRLNAET